MVTRNRGQERFPKIHNCWRSARSHKPHIPHRFQPSHPMPRTVPSCVEAHMHHNRAPVATIGSVARTVSIGFCFSHAATALLWYSGNCSGLGGGSDALKQAQPVPISSRSTWPLSGSYSTVPPSLSPCTRAKSPVATGSSVPAGSGRRNSRRPRSPMQPDAARCSPSSAGSVPGRTWLPGRPGPFECVCARRGVADVRAERQATTASLAESALFRLLESRRGVRAKRRWNQWEVGEVGSRPTAQTPLTSQDS